MIHGEADPQSTFLLRPYTANNVLLLDDMAPAGRLTLATPTPAVALAFATVSGYGPGDLTATVHFADGTPDVQAAFQSPDWFGQGQVIVSTHNRVYVANGTYDFIDPINPLRYPGPVLWEQGVPLSGLAEARPVTAVDLSWLPADPQRPTHTSIFGLSTAAMLAGPFTAAPLTDDSFNQDVVVEASAVPDPASAFFMLAATLPLPFTNARTRRPHTASLT